MGAFQRIVQDRQDVGGDDVPLRGHQRTGPRSMEGRHERESFANSSDVADALRSTAAEKTTAGPMSSVCTSRQLKR
jgi:hypothetical protein